MLCLLLSHALAQVPVRGKGGVVNGQGVCCPAVILFILHDYVTIDHLADEPVGLNLSSRFCSS